MSSSGKRKKKKGDGVKKVELPPWTYEEKQKFVSALCKGPPYRHENGKINWIQLKRLIGSRSLQEVKNFAKNFHALEHGDAYEEFASKAAIDVWKQLAEKTTAKDDKIADICIPQVFTVTALEPINLKSDAESSSQESESIPSYKKIYNYMSSITRGVDSVQLNTAEATIVLSLLEDLILTLSKSQTLIQREHLHSSYEELRKYLNFSEDEDNSDEKEKYLSINPLGIPFEILNFNLLEQCSENTPTDTKS